MTNDSRPSAAECIPRHLRIEPMSKPKRRKAVVALVERDGTDCHYCGVALADPVIPGTTRPAKPLARGGGPCGCGEGFGPFEEGPYYVCHGHCEHVEPGIAPLGNRDWATIDHVIARARGGTHDLDNLVLSCLSCNCKKGTK